MTQNISVNFPDIGEGVVEGEVIQWLKQVNDTVKEHEPVVIVMTDKATVELPSPYDGKISKLHFKVGEIAIRDKPLYDVEVAATVAQQVKETPEKIPLEKLKQNEKKPITPPTPLPTKNPTTKAIAAPSTRKLAKDLGIDINTIQGTGPDGRVIPADLRQEQKPLHALGKTPILHWDDDDEFPLRGIRHLIAEKMVESTSIIPHFSFFDQMDVSRLVKMREQMKREAHKENLALTYMPFFIRALSLCIKRYPIFNGSVDQKENTLVIHKHHNFGIAFNTEAGLIVPVLKNVQEMSLHQIIRAYDAFIHKASQGKLMPSDMRESTITISNFGSLGGLWATPIINYPEVAILGVAKIHKEPVVVNDAIVIRELLNLSWSFDHRIIDGSLAAEFSNYFIGLLKNPAGLL